MAEELLNRIKSMIDSNQYTEHNDTLEALKNQLISGMEGELESIKTQLDTIEKTTEEPVSVNANEGGRKRRKSRKSRKSRKMKKSRKPKRGKKSNKRKRTRRH